MKREEIKETIQGLMSNRSDKPGIPLDEITEDAKLRDDLGYDSLDEIELVMDCEKEFSIEIPDDELENRKDNTFGTFVDVVVKYIE